MKTASYWVSHFDVFVWLCYTISQNRPYILNFQILIFKMQDLEMSIGGERKVMKFDGEPKFHAMYEIESPEVLVSDAWGKAVELGRWPEQVRPYTRNRRHILSQRLG